MSDPKGPDVEIDGSIRIFGRTYSLKTVGWVAVAVIAAVALIVILAIR